MSTHLNIEINEITLGCEDDVQRLAAAIEGVCAPRTIGNYVSAMRQYVAMIQTMMLPVAPKLSDDIGNNMLTEAEKLLNDAVDGDEVTDDERSVEKHFRHSSFREKLLEHLFVAEILKRSWLEHSCDVEIAKPEVDSKGYDLIAEKDGVVRHLQLKSTKCGGNAATQNIHIALAAKPVRLCCLVGI